MDGGGMGRDGEDVEMLGARMGHVGVGKEV